MIRIASIPVLIINYSCQKMLASELSSFRMINWRGENEAFSFFFGWKLRTQEQEGEKSEAKAADDEKRRMRLNKKRRRRNGDGWKFDLKRFDLFFLFFVVVLYFFCCCYTAWKLFYLYFSFLSFFSRNKNTANKWKETSKTSVGFKMTFVNLKIKFSSFSTSREKAR